MNSGRIRILSVMKMNVLIKESTAETGPLFSDVNIAEEKIFRPAKIKLKENRKNPVRANSYVFVPGGVKMLTITGEAARAAAVMAAEAVTVKVRQIRTIRRSSGTFLDPSL